jgi:hypothetical protein
MYKILTFIWKKKYFQFRDYFQDFGNTTHTHGIGNFSRVLLKVGEKMHD